MVLYSSSSLVAAWLVQCAVNTKTSLLTMTTYVDAILKPHHLQAAQASSNTTSVNGGLSSLFANLSDTRHVLQSFSPSLSDGHEVVASIGGMVMVRSHSQLELSSLNMLPLEDNKSFTGGVTIPLASSSSSLRSREHISPISMLQGHVFSSSRNNTIGSPICSLNAQDSASINGAVPPFDLHNDRISSRRRSSLTLDTNKWPLSRNVGFEVGSGGGFNFHTYLNHSLACEIWKA